jgi:chaperone modulatory protein CbpM
MNNNPHIDTVRAEDQLEFTLVELSLVCHVDTTQLAALVDEGVLQPFDAAPTDGQARQTGQPQERWRFDGSSLGQALAAVRLARDFELSAAGTALALDLLGQIRTLRARLRHLGLE